MLKHEANIDDDATVKMFGVEGIIIKSSSTWMEIQTAEETVQLPLVLLLFNKL